MTKQKKVSYVNVYKKLAKEKKEAQAKKRETVVAECGAAKQTFKVEVDNKKPRITKVNKTPKVSKERGFKRDVKKLHSVWDFIKTQNLILKVFSCYTIKDGKKVNLNIFSRYVKFLHKENKFWLINCNFIFDPSKVLPKNEIIGAHIYSDGNMQFTTKTNMYITCEPYYGKKVKKDGENR